MMPYTVAAAMLTSLSDVSFAWIAMRTEGSKMKKHILAVSLAVGLLANSAVADEFSACVRDYNNSQYSLALQPCTAEAERGNLAAQWYLAVMYEYGRGVSQNYSEAIKWYGLLAEKGFASAQRKLGWIYWQGLGVVQNYSEALRWYHAAAEQGDANAQNALGVMHQYGYGVIQNYVLAHMWYNISASHKSYEIAVNNRYRIAALMTPQQIAEAQTRAQRCLDNNYSDC